MIRIAILLKGFVSDDSNSIASRLLAVAYQYRPKPQRRNASAALRNSFECMHQYNSGQAAPNSLQRRFVGSARGFLRLYAAAFCKVMHAAYQFTGEARVIDCKRSANSDESATDTVACRSYNPFF